MPTSHSQPTVVSVEGIEVPTPEGGATEAKQDDIITAIENITIDPPVGGATEAKQDTQITHLAAIETAVEILDNAISGNEMQVDVVSSALPSGAATSANQTTIIGHVDGIEGLLTTINAALATGMSIFKSIDLDESEEEIKDTGGTIHFIAVFNATAAPLWLKLYNADADDVTVGTTVPDATLLVPANADSDGAGFILPIPPCGIAFGTAITAACTTGRADNDSGAPGAGDCTILVGYK